MFNYSDTFEFLCKCGLVCKLEVRGDIGHLKTIANSIINVPWLRLKQVDFDVTQGGLYQPEHCFEELKARLLAKLRHHNLRDWKAQHRARQELPFLDIRKRFDFEHLIESHRDVMKMYVDLQFTHPISDKPYYVISFPGYLEATATPGNSNQRCMMYSSLVSKEMFSRNLWTDGTYTVPDVAFVAHVTLFIPKLKKKKVFTCLVFGQDLQPVSTDEARSNPSSSSNPGRQPAQYSEQQSKEREHQDSTQSNPADQPRDSRSQPVNRASALNQEYYVHLNIDHECGITLFFKGHYSGSSSGSVETSGNGFSQSWQTPTLQTSQTDASDVRHSPSVASPNLEREADSQIRFPNRFNSEQNHPSQSIAGFSFSQILCELYISPEEYSHKISNDSQYAAYETEYTYNNHHPAQQDSFTINNTQNNYYFNGTSGYYPVGPQAAPLYMDEPHFDEGHQFDQSYFEQSEPL